MRRLLALWLSALLSGCWVAPSPVSKNVAVMNGVDVASCRLVGKGDLSVPTTLGTLQRMSDDMENDLQTLAKNQAVNVGADTVAPLTVQNGGNQSWGYYACGPAAMAATAANPAITSPAPAATTGVKTLPYTPPL